MDIAIVTGASSSLGLAISRRLIQLGFRVYGLGGDYTDCPLQNVNFRPVSCNLADPAAVEAAANRILEKEKGVLVLVNNAKYFGSQSYLEMSPTEMQRVLNINLLCPLVLSRTFAQGLIDLQGYIIQLGPLHVESNRGGPTGAASAGGLKWMSELLFQDLRQYGVKVCHLSPEPNRGRDPRTTVRQGSRVTSSIDPEAVAQAVEQLLQSPFGNIITEMVMRPLRVSEPDQEPVVKLPYPKPKPIPYTVPRELIEAEEQLDEEDYRKSQQERQKRRKEGAAKKAARKTPQKRGRKDASEEEDSVKPAEQDQAVEKDESSSETQQQKKRSRPQRTRKKRARPERTGNEKAESKPARKETEDKQPSRKETDRKKPEDKQPARKETEAPRDAESQPEQSRRRRRRKPRPPKVEVGFHQDSREPTPEKKQPEKKAEESSREKPVQTDRDSDKPVRKKARKRVPKKASAEKQASRDGKPEGNPEGAKKAAKKATRKTARKAVKKTARKAAKKVARKRAPAKKASSRKSEGGTDSGGKSD